MIESRIEEVAAAHGVPVDMLRKAIDLERQSITLQNRRMVPRLRELISAFAATVNLKSGEDQ